MGDSSSRPIPWALFVSELIGTALLVLVGLSLVILMFGAGTPMAHLISIEGLVTGFFFGTTGTLHCAFCRWEGERSQGLYAVEMRVKGANVAK